MGLAIALILICALIGIGIYGTYWWEETAIKSDYFNMPDGSTKYYGMTSRSRCVKIDCKMCDRTNWLRKSFLMHWIRAKTKKEFLTLNWPCDSCKNDLGLDIFNSKLVQEAYFKKEIAILQKEETLNSL